MSPSPSNRPGGRQKRIVSGGGNAYRRGSGLGGGPVGGGFSGGFSGGSSGGSTGGNRAGGNSGCNPLALIIALLVGRSAANGGNGSKRGCIGRLIIFLLVAGVVYYFLRSCSVGNVLSGYGYDTPSGGGTGLSGQVLQQEEPAASADVEAASASPLFSGLNSVSTAAAPATNSAYKAHEPDYTVDGSARERYTSLSGNGQDQVTVMLYLCGTDLESKSGMATADLNEMISARFSDNVRIIVETGGCSQWQNSVISTLANQIYEVRQGGIKALEKNLPRQAMTDPATLSSFIQYCSKNYPADRNILILWDHGGGSLSGYGYDELAANNDTMTLDEIGRALKDGGCRFDVVGFDACLMATLETALVLEPYADYMIASEATEPGTGWYYTNWVTALSADTSMPTVDLAKNIIDDFVKVSQQASSSSSATLSVIDLAELRGTVPASFTNFSDATSQLIAADGYQQVSDARSGAKDFSVSSRINQIDLINFADNLNTKESNALAAALRSCVKYNRISSNIANAYGVSIYFPYNSLNKVSAAVNTYEKIGMDESYTKCIKSFASMAAGGSVVSGGYDNPLGSLMGDTGGSLLGSLLSGYTGSSPEASSYSSGSADAMSSLLGMFLDSSNRSVVTGDEDSSWVDGELLSKKADYFAKNTSGFNSLALSSVNGRTVLALTEDQWSKVRTLEQNVFLDDGSGYIDLGLDNVMEWDDDGNLIMDYDGTWLSMNKQIVSYYLISQDFVGDSYTILGRVPAMLTKSGEAAQRVNLILSFTDRSPDGELLGAQTDYENVTDVVGKGLLAVDPGDKLDFLCDYYGYDGTYLDSYYLGEQMTVPASKMEIGNAYLNGTGGLDGVKFRMTYRLTDAYGAQYWTPAVTGE